MDVKVVNDRSHWFTVQLHDLGYREGVNMELLVLKANGSAERAESLLQEALEKDPPDLVVSNATLASKAAAKLLKGTNIPQLFVARRASDHLDPHAVDFGQGLERRADLSFDSSAPGRGRPTERDAHDHGR